MNNFWWLAIGFGAGVLGRSFFNLGDAFWLWLILLALAAFGQSHLASASHQKRLWTATGLLCLTAALGVIGFEIKDQSAFAAAARRATQNEERVAVVGTVAAEPTERDQNSQLVFRPDNWPIKILLITPLYPERAYGDRLKIAGKLEPVQDFVSPAGQVVRYRDYLSVNEIYFQMFEPEIELIGQGGSDLKRALFRFKQALLQKLTLVLPEPESALLGGLVFGGRQSLGEEWNERFRRVGLSHIVVLSGFNLAVIAAVILRLLRPLPRRLGLPLAGLAIILFTIMTGAEPATVRAAVMALIALLAVGTGRLYAASRALVLAGLLMVAINPKVLAFDLGFQLSFLATAGLIYLTPRLEKRLTFLTARWGVRTLVAATLAAQLTVLPWLVFRTGQVPWLALPVNLVVLPVVPYAMLAGFLTMALGFLPGVLAGLAWPAAAGAWLLAAYILTIADWGARLF
ncbi:MAG: ComEC/Rec2 family competence protein [Candidatus Vogelbacteria bacterium]|nr:ComEC/Rec2 family competence protein [Candidatus Vogelbacteria bacterium]